MPIDIDEARARFSDLAPTDRSEIREAVGALAQPRLCGSEGAGIVESEILERFSAFGYECEAGSFSFSSFHGRFALMVSGGVVGVSGAMATALIYAGLPIPGLVVLGLGLLLAVLPVPFGAMVMRRLPWARLEARNLLFRRPGARPAWILMAHRDTKGQAVPALVRALAIAVAVAAWAGLVILAAFRLAGVDGLGPPLLLVGGVLLAAGATLGLGRVTNNSPGALDNASGLAALLAVAKREESGAIAFLITDGEELDLAGARAAALRLPPVQGVINVDGLDDRGRFYVAEGHGWRRRRGRAPQLAAALMVAGSALDLPVERRRLPAMVAVDHVPLSAAGIPALTLMRGQWRSLMRVHRPGDSAEHLDGRGAAQGATLLTAAVRLLSADGPSRLARGHDAGP